jgi:hypothetical protein
VWHPLLCVCGFCVFVLFFVRGSHRLPAVHGRERESVETGKKEI